MVRVKVILCWITALICWVAVHGGTECRRLVSKWEKEERELLCSSHDPNQAFKCYEQVKFSLPHKEAVKLCAESLDRDRAATCVKAISLKLNPLATVELCTNATSDMSEKCYQAIENEHVTQMHAARLCKQNTPNKFQAGLNSFEQIKSCLQLSMTSLFLSEDDATTLCEQNASILPISCFQSARENRGLSKDAIIDVCSKAPSDQTGLCLQNCPQSNRRGIELDACADTCAKAVHAGAGTCVKAFTSTGSLEKFLPNNFNFETNATWIVPLAVQLCATANSAAPTKCLSRAQFTSSTSLEDRIYACQGLKEEDSLSDRIACIKNGPVSFSLALRTMLCNGTATSHTIDELDGPLTVTSATSATQPLQELGPSVCAKGVLRKQLPFSELDVIRLCRAHRSQSRLSIHGQARVECIQPLKSALARVSTPLPETSLQAVRSAAIEICLKPSQRQEHLDNAHWRMRCVVESARSAGKAWMDRPEASNELVQLCLNAQDDAPVKCVAYALKNPVSLSFTNAVKLCRERDQGEVGSPVASLCCLKRTVKTLPFESLERLRQAGVLSAVCSTIEPAFCSAPSECLAAFKSSQDQLLPIERLADLCQGPDASLAALCAKRILAHSTINQLSVTQVVHLCTSALPFNAASQPLQCFDAGLPLVKRGRLGDQGKNILLDLCSGPSSGAQAAACAEAYLRLTPSKTGSDSVAAFCKASLNVSHVETCFSNLPEVLNTLPLRDRLCRGKDHQARLNCAATALKELGALPFVQPNTVVELCDMATSEAPARCASALFQAVNDIHTNKVLLSSTAKQYFVELCKYPESRQENIAALVECFTNLVPSHAFKVLGPEKIIRVCRSVKNGSRALTCINDASRRYPPLSNETIFKLCSSPHHSYGGTCAKNAPEDWQEENILQLCSGERALDGKATAQCASSTMLSLGWNSQKSAAVLCRNVHTSPEKHIACAREMETLFTWLKVHQISALCEDSVDQKPLVECLNEMEHHNRLQEEHKIKLCKPFSSITSQEQAKTGAEKLKNLTMCLDVLETTMEAYEFHHLLGLCQAPNMVQAAKCFADAPTSWTSQEKFNLCNNNNMTSSFAATCAQDLSMEMNRFSVQQIIEICNGATSPAPALCAKQTLEWRLPQALARQLCPGAQNTTPQKCLSYVVGTKYEHKWYTVPYAEVENCRMAVAVPSKISVEHTEALVEMQSHPIVAEQLLATIRLKVLDQFDFPLGPSFLGPPGSQIIQASLQRRGVPISLVQNLVGNTSAVFTNTSRIIQPEEMEPQARPFAFLEEQPLQAEFSNLTVSDTFGELDLEFRTRSLALPPYVLSLTVSKNLDAMLKKVFTCDSIPTRLQCSWTSDPAFCIEDAVNTRALHRVALPWAALLWDPLCESRMKSMGIGIPQGQRLNPWIGIFVDVLPGPAKLLSEIGIPTASMSAEQVLEISPDASTLEIRRAYHKASLEWHPDRWVSFHPDMQAKAASIFSLVAEANRILLEKKTANEKE